jgi:hypothetical protein
MARVGIEKPPQFFFQLSCYDERSIFHQGTINLPAPASPV